MTGPPGMQRPIFIVGSNRSGTTLLRLMLNAHSRIGIPEEIVYLDSRVAGVPVEQWRHPGLSEAAYRAFVDDFLLAQRDVLDGVDFSAVRAAALNGEKDLRRPYEALLRHWARSHGKERWGEKTPGNLYYADVLLDMFPEARFLHLVRDPRAGVSSMQRVDFFTDDVVFNAMTRKKDLVEGATRLERDVPASRRMTLRYEDLVRAPEASLRTVCAFIAEDFEPGMLRYFEEADRYMKTEASSRFNAKATRPVSADQVSAWKQRMSRREVAIVEHVCGDQLKRFGYEPTGEALSGRDRAEIALKAVYWNLQCWRNRDIRHYYVNYPIFARLRARLRRAAWKTPVGSRVP